MGFLLALVLTAVLPLGLLASVVWLTRRESPVGAGPEARLRVRRSVGAARPFAAAAVLASVGIALEWGPRHSPDWKGAAFLVLSLAPLALAWAVLLQPWIVRGPPWRAALLGASIAPLCATTFTACLAALMATRMDALWTFIGFGLIGGVILPFPGVAPALGAAAALWMRARHRAPGAVDGANRCKSTV